MDRTWVIGGNGQIGHARSSDSSAIRALAPSVEELDLSFPDRIDSCFDRLEAQAGRPAAIINAAAYTLVEQAEHEESLARRINAEAPGAMASLVPAARRSLPSLLDRLRLRRHRHLALARRRRHRPPQRVRTNEARG